MFGKIAKLDKEREKFSEEVTDTTENSRKQL